MKVRFHGALSNSECQRNVSLGHVDQIPKDDGVTLPARQGLQCLGERDTQNGGVLTRDGRLNLERDSPFRKCVDGEIRDDPENPRIKMVVGMNSRPVRVRAGKRLRGQVLRDGSIANKPIRVSTATLEEPGERRLELVSPAHISG